MSDKRSFKLHDSQSGAAIAVRVTPRASKNEIFQIQDDGTVKIRLTAPPVEGAANQGLIAFLSEILDVRPSQIDIVAGFTGKDKLVTITGLDAATVQSRIIRHLSE